MVCRNCGAIIINGKNLLHTKDTEFDFYVPEGKFHTGPIEITEWICPKCKTHNVVEATNQ